MTIKEADRIYRPQNVAQVTVYNAEEPHGMGEMTTTTKKRKLADISKSSRIVWYWDNRNGETPPCRLTMMDEERRLLEEFKFVMQTSRRRSRPEFPQLDAVVKNLRCLRIEPLRNVPVQRRLRDGQQVLVP